MSVAVRLRERVVGIVERTLSRYFVGIRWRCGRSIQGGI